MNPESKGNMTIGIAADHGGYNLKESIAKALRNAGYEVTDYGASQLNPDDDYPDFVIPLAKGIARGDVARGIAICGSGVGASFAANRVPGVRAALITDVYSAHQGVEDDDMNLMCLGGRVVGIALAWDLIRTYLAAHFAGTERFQRRLDKVAALERREERE